MKIAFVCSSLESGRDGVGDYTRSLAEECARAGHEVALLALHDRHLSTPVAEDLPPTLRLPAAMPWAERTRRAEEFFAKFDPQWISLQFVCYGFHPKGLVHGLAGKLAPLLRGRKLHIMFHELWIGDHIGASVKESCVGWIQRELISQLVRKLRPSVISTSNGTYIAMLKTQGFTALPLPLFGSIPIVEKPDYEWLFGHAATASLAVTSENRCDFWIFGLFATLYPGWEPEPLFSILQRSASVSGKRVIIATIGRIGPSGEGLWEDLTQTYSRHFSFLRFGEQPTARVSAYLQWIDGGIAASPLALIGKSASVAAMLEHGLPVMANRDNWHWRTGGVPKSALEPLLHKVDEDLETKLKAGLPRGGLNPRLPHVAQTFIGHLSASSA